MAVCRRVDGAAFIMPLAQAFFGWGRRVHASRAQARRCRGRAGNQKFGQSAHRPLRPRTRAISVEEVEGLADLLLLLLGQASVAALALVTARGAHHCF